MLRRIIADKNVVAHAVLQELRAAKVLEQRPLTFDNLAASLQRKCGQMRGSDLGPVLRREFREVLELVVQERLSRGEVSGTLSALSISERGEEAVKYMPTLIPQPAVAVLQVSDVHFGPGMHVYSEKNKYTSEQYGRVANSDAVELALNVRNSLAAAWPMPVDAVALCGDLCGFESDWSSQLDLAKGFLAELKVAEKGRCVVVPGNHDVEWNPHVQNRLQHFKKFAMELQAAGLVVDALGDNGTQVLTFKKNGESVVVFGLNSASIETEETRGMGYIGPGPIKKVKTELTSAHATWSIGVVHHHVLPVDLEDESLIKWHEYLLEGSRSKGVDLKEVPGFSQLADSGRLLRYAIEDGYDLLLHGHMHRLSALTCSGERSSGGRALAYHAVGVIGCPSLSVSSRYVSIGEPNGFNLILLYDEPRRAIVVPFARELAEDVSRPYVPGRQRELRLA